MLLGLVFYFLLVVAVLALVCLPPLRDKATAGVHGAWLRGWQMSAAWRASGTRNVGRRSASTRGWARQWRTVLKRHAVSAFAALAAVVVLPLTAVVLRASFPVDSFDPNAAHAVDERVAELLVGEDLVPPPPLPPDLFTAPEVEQWQPLVRSASRQWDLLDEAFRQRLLMSFKLLRAQYGYEMVLLEGYRSPQRQAALAALGPTVTRAGPFESYHQYGLAADCAFLRDGHIVISEKDPWAMAGYERYGQIAKSLGLVWGGDWRRLRDLGHVELHRARSMPAAGDVAEAATPAGR